MFRFLAEILFWSLPDVIGWSVVCAFDKACSTEPPSDGSRKTGFDDAIYKKNLQRLIERNRRFEEGKE